MHINRKVKNSLFVVCALAGIFGIARFCHHATRGFRLAKIESNFPLKSSPINASDEDKAFVSELFQQNFYFLSRGFQSFVFASEDGKYVLKLFNNRHQTKLKIFSLLTHLPLIDHWANQRSNYYEQKLSQTFESYHIAFDEMKEMTGLIYLHLSPTTNLPEHLTLVDPLNISHRINPNNTGFLIQKRAVQVYPALKQYVLHNDMDGAKHALSSLVELFFWKWRHAIADNDPLIRTNYGFVDGNAIQLDVGPLSKEASNPDISLQRTQIERITASLKFWLNENAPDLVPFLDEEMQQQLSSVD